MKPLIIFLYTAVVLVFALVGRTLPATAETAIFGTSINYAPYEIYPPENGLRGFDVEVVEAAFERAGVTVQIEYLSWARAMSMAKVGHFAGLITCTYRPEREEFFLFSDTISHTTDGFWMRRDSADPELKTIQDARGYSVGGILEYSSLKDLQKVNPEAVTFRTETRALKSLLMGSYQYLYLSMEVTEYLAKRMGSLEKLKFSAIKTKDFVICFSKKWPGVEDLMAKFNKGLAAVKADGTYDKIHDRYR